MRRFGSWVTRVIGVGRIIKWLEHCGYSRRGDRSDLRQFLHAFFKSLMEVDFGARFEDSGVRIKTGQRLVRVKEASTEWFQTRELKTPRRRRIGARRR